MCVHTWGRGGKKREKKGNLFPVLLPSHWIFPHLPIILPLHCAPQNCALLPPLLRDHIVQPQGSQSLSPQRWLPHFCVHSSPCRGSARPAQPRKLPQPQQCTPVQSASSPSHSRCSLPVAPAPGQEIPRLSPCYTLTATPPSSLPANSSLDCLSRSPFLFSVPKATSNIQMNTQLSPGERIFLPSACPTGHLPPSPTPPPGPEDLGRTTLPSAFPLCMQSVLSPPQFGRRTPPASHFRGPVALLPHSPPSPPRASAFVTSHLDALPILPPSLLMGHPVLTFHPHPDPASWALSLMAPCFKLSNYFWLRWVFAAACGLSPAVVSRGYSLAAVLGFSRFGAQALGEQASVAVCCGL